MSWMKIFKKVFEGEQEKPIEVSVRQISLAEIPFTVQEELKQRNAKLEELKKSAVEKIDSFRLDIEMDVRVLKNINLDKRKENAKLKSTVLSNLKLYIEYLTNLTSDMDSIKSLPPLEYLSKASKFIENFSKNSRAAYEKATVLIGDELGRAREKVKAFMEVIYQIMENSKTLSREMELVSSLEKTYVRLEEIKRNADNLSILNSELSSQITNIKQKQEDDKKQIEESKKSAAYKQSEEEKQNARDELSRLDARMQEIKDKIDLKLLSKYFHNDLKKSALINKYADNFKAELKNDVNLELIEVVRQAKGIDVSSLQEIRKREAELESLPESEIDKKILLLIKDMELSDSEIRSKEKEVEENSKKAEKLTERNKEVIEEIKAALAKINLALKE